MSLPHYHLTIDTEAVKTLADVVFTLNQLTSVLSGTDLSSLVVFNRMYIIITNHYIQAVAEGWFEQPETVARLGVTFANYYFHALNTHAQTGVLPEVWDKFIDYRRQPKRPVFIALLLAANAHINHDLALSIRDTGLAADAKSDFRRSARIFRQASSEIITAFREPELSMNYFKRKLKFLYQWPMIAIILHYRRRAWKQGQRLLRGSITTSTITRQANRIATTLLRLS